MTAERFGITWLVFVGSAALFYLAEGLNAYLHAHGRPYLVPSIPAIDGHIPFSPTWVFAYYLYYPALFSILLCVRDRRSFVHGGFAFVSLQVASSAMYVLLPTHMIRPEIVGHSVAEEMLRAMYRADAGYNLLPSLHVAHSVLIASFYWTYFRKWFPPVALMTTLITISTVMVKQHYVSDIPAGVLFGLGAFLLTRPLVRHIDNESAPTERVLGTDVSADE